ncbi:MAG: pyridoxamine 5'-phosphate oxidase family protein [Verrucomicrobiaceae bacterium]|nr:MAG: pyridoxamine 5'-phosphate oxidase family protein [Verrucomicrobiaceae bacterium]
MTPDPRYFVSTPNQLAGLFGDIGEAALKKELSFIHPHYRALIEASPFAILATSGPDGLDASPRGDPPGFVIVEDESTLLMPERRGNNRVDSLRNLLVDPRMALLFLIPGLGETLRVNGRASISIEPALLERFSMKGHLPKCVLVIKVESVFFQCARAIQRSKLWEYSAQDGKPALPSAGSILAALTDHQIDGEKYDREAPVRQRSTLY